MHSDVSNMKNTYKKLSRRQKKAKKCIVQLQTRKVPTKNSQKEQKMHSANTNRKIPTKKLSRRKKMIKNA